MGTVTPLDDARRLRLRDLFEALLDAATATEDALAGFEAGKRSPVAVASFCRRLRGIVETAQDDLADFAPAVGIDPATLDFIRTAR